jgi:RHS repeat-associated protein
MLVGKERNGQMIETLGWDGIGLLAKGDTVYANEAHISGGTPLVSIDSGGKSTYFDHDYLGTTTATYSEDGATDVHLTGSLGRGSETSNVRFTGKPYDEDLGAHVFPFRNYRSDAGRWTSADPAGFPDGPNQHFYAPVPTTGLDPWGLYESGDTRWIHGEYTITGTWTERFEAGVSGGAIGLSFGGPSISVSFGAGWTMVDGSDSYPQTAGEQGGEVTAPNGWDWVPETIVNYNHDPQATEYGEVYTEGGYYVNVAQPDVPLDGVPLDLVGPGPNEYDYIPKITLKDSTKDVIFYWKRQAIEL